MIYNILMMGISLLVPIWVVRKDIQKTDTIKEFILKNKFALAVYILLVIGMAIRTMGIQSYPIGLGKDEASAGYEAFSILHWGMDRHLNHFPVHFVAWGSGQNILYSYICIPFVACMGLTELAIRLPMAMMGCVTLIAVSFFAKKYTNPKFTLILLFLLTISPWHIMKSRWGLESNIFPDLVLLASMMIVYGMEEKKNGRLLFGFVLLGVSAYSYGTAYFFLPVYVILLLAYGMKQKKISLKMLIMVMIILMLIATPLLLFITINYFRLPEMNLGWITIPRITTNRYQSITSIFSGHFFTRSGQNFLESIKMLIRENDGLAWNTMSPYGILYRATALLTMVGCVISYLNKQERQKGIHYVVICWMIASILLMFVCEPNITRLNIIIFPMIYYNAVVIYTLLTKIPKSKYVVLPLYSIGFVLFSLSYFHITTNQTAYFETDIKEMIEYVSSIENRTIYMSDNIGDMYIYVLFYGKENPIGFYNTVAYATKGRSFEQVRSFGKYCFYLPDKIEDKTGAAYVLPKEQKPQINDNYWKITEFQRFVVIEGKG